MPRPRVRSQLAVQVPPELLERVRAVAAAQRRTVTALVVEALEQALDGGSRPGGNPGDGTALLERIEALERAVAELKAQRAARPEAELLEPTAVTVRAVRSPRPRSRVQVEQSAAVAQVLPSPTGAITTARLAEVLGVRRSSFNERIRRAGGARVGLELNGWRCVGQQAPDAGGPPRWLWEQAANLPPAG